jgi:hypothetical protein
MAAELNEPLWRVTYALRTRPDIRPIGRAGILRLYGPEAVDQVRAVLEETGRRQRTCRREEATIG